MLIAIEGCLHGELTTVYETLLAAPERPQLLLCCGDFQSIRNYADLDCLAVSQKYRRLGDFHQYYGGEKKAPILTIFVGGNHEASNFLQELPYGGWVAPNIFYLGSAGVVSVGGLRIGGISGIYKGHDYYKGRHETCPYSEDTKRSVYHYRNLEVFRLQQLGGTLDIFMSHDWPCEITQYGNLKSLLREKPYFEDDIRQGRLGSPPLKTLLEHMKPKYWFAGHLHCHFPALVPHKDSDSMTRFLALDKCLPHRKFLQILNIPHDDNTPVELRHDLEWLTVLRLTNHLLSVRPTTYYMPNKNSNERWNFLPTEEEKQTTLDKMQDDLLIHENFEMTSEAAGSQNESETNATPMSNPQTLKLCDRLQLDDPVGLIMLQKGVMLKSFTPAINSSISEEIDLEPDSSENCSSQTQSTESIPLTSPRLSLPEPVQKYEECERDVSLNSSTLETEVSDLNDSSSCEVTPSQKRTFKRRNESLYKSVSEDM